MTPPIRFIMVGGFLGAGKTTTLARLARHYTDAGKKVGLVTNDQAYDLVDTHALRAAGFRVGEVPGACFCCKFDDLIRTAGDLSEDERPDIIITEPVGSCTDLVATVIEPLKHLHGDAYEIAPLAVLLKPEHGRKILGDEPGVGFSPKAAYIFLKQIEEAGIVVLNKIDKLSQEEQSRLCGLVEERFPGKQVLTASAKTGRGFDELLKALEAPAAWSHPMMQVDYQIYAEGEAELGWLNCTAHFQPEAGGEAAFTLDRLVLDLVSLLAAALEGAGAEPAHLKVLGMSGEDTAIANLVGSGVEAELSLAAEVDVPHADLIVNARVATDPETLVRFVEDELRATAASRGLSVRIENVQHFRPAPPVPTHRYG